jgi:hypothetical protein
MRLILRSPVSDGVTSNRDVSVYSHRFFCAEVTVGVTTIYTVPAGSTAILRDLELFNASSATQTFTVYLVQPGLGGVPAIVINSIGAALGEQWQGRVVLNAGDSLQTGTGASSQYMVLSGYLFED